MRHFVFFLLALFIPLTGAEVRFGVATVDISPSGPIRLSGYAARKTESSEVARPLEVKAIALETSPTNTALLLTIDNVGISKEIHDTIAGQLERTEKIPADRIVIFSTHTHSAPCLSNSLANLFVMDLPEDQMRHINDYTTELITRAVKAGREALQKRAPGAIYLTRGSVGFAKNRRTAGGPVNHELPVLVFKNKEDEVKAILANYACHCTTLGANFNQAHPDWAGFARSYIEKQHPGATALISIGCGADANPNPRGKVENADDHGKALADEVSRLLQGPLEEITGELQTRADAFDLPFDPLPTREQWEERAKAEGIVGYHARKNLARLDRGEKLPTALPYSVATWNFGDQLAMVFLPGEVVVDYALRLKGEYDPQRLWVNGYSNWVPCYIPSRRILKEGGYEAEQSLWYYDRPARLSPETESLIIDSVARQLPKTFRALESRK